MVFDDLDKAPAEQPLVPTKASQSSNDGLLIPINDDHNEQSYSSQPLMGNNVSRHPPFSNLDPTLDLTTSSSATYHTDLNIPNNLIINESETILPDVACVTQGNFNMSIHSYGSNQDGENQPLLKRMDTDSTHVISNSFPDDAEFTGFIREVEQAIENGFLPERISQGSSGSYFVKNSEGNVCLQQSSFTAVSSTDY